MKAQEMDAIRCGVKISTCDTSLIFRSALIQRAKRRASVRSITTTIIV